MAEHMLKFVSVPQSTPEKRQAEERRVDFDEIYRDFATRQAAEQASRCSPCGVPFCQVHCPLQQQHPRLAEADRRGPAGGGLRAVAPPPTTSPRSAAASVRRTGSAKATASSRSGPRHASPSARSRSYITDTAWEKGWVKPLAAAPRAGAVGRHHRRRARRAWPRPSSCAGAGYQVTVYDRYDRAGGLLIYGIPNFKLEKEVVAAPRASCWSDGGIRFQLNFEVGRDADAGRTARAARRGADRHRRLQAARHRRPASGLPGIVPALDYLIASNREGLGDTVPEFDSGALDARGKHVVVIGGGDTAMDCVRTAVRQGAKSVNCLYRRDRANMPGSHARGDERRGGRRRVRLARRCPRPSSATTASPAVRAARMRLGLPDASGRQAPEPIEGSRFQPARRSRRSRRWASIPRTCPRLFDAPELDGVPLGHASRSIPTRLHDQPATACSPPATSCAAPRWWSGRSATAAMRPRRCITYLQARRALAAAAE